MMPKDDLSEDSALLLDSAIESNLKMTYEQRIEAHENARRLAEYLRKVGETLKTLEFDKEIEISDLLEQHRKDDERYLELQDRIDAFYNSVDLDSDPRLAKAKADFEENKKRWHAARAAVNAHFSKA